MSEDILEIHRMIQRAVIGDGDEVLNIMEKMLNKIAELEREVQALHQEANTHG